MKNVLGEREKKGRDGGVSVFGRNFSPFLLLIFSFKYRYMLFLNPNHLPSKRIQPGYYVQSTTSLCTQIKRMIQMWGKISCNHSRALVERCTGC